MYAKREKRITLQRLQKEASIHVTFFQFLMLENNVTHKSN